MDPETHCSNAVWRLNGSRGLSRQAKKRGLLYPQNSICEVQRRLVARFASPLVAPCNPLAMFNQFQEIAAMNGFASKEMPMFMCDRFPQLAFKEINDSAARDRDLAKFKGRERADHDGEYNAPSLTPRGPRIERDSGSPGSRCRWMGRFKIADNRN